MKKNTNKKDHFIDISFKSETIRDPLKMDDSIAANYRGCIALDP
ncbi:MAG: hydrogenase, partial [Nitrosopumilales archaeon CG_4_9_14_0_8_um_filter_34_10]